MAARETTTIGSTFGRLTVLEPMSIGSGNRKYRCICSCGNETFVRNDHLKEGRSRSCGCLSKETAEAKVLVHGHNRRGQTSPEYKAWTGMVGRCRRNTPGNKAWSGRGIKVCERWGRFENFLADLGLRPSAGHSIDRINVNGNYEPGNVRWATIKQQARNKTSNIYLEHNGERLNLGEWAERTGIKYGTIRWRVMNGLTSTACLKPVA